MSGWYPWPFQSSERRWYGFGRYYAMFPPSFVYDAIVQFTSPGDLVLDPFCGRGNAPYIAATLARPSVGIDINPVAWLFTQVKLEPEPDVFKLKARLEEIGRARRPCDKRPDSEFERMAWAPNVLAYLRTARRELDWKTSVTDRTLMGFIVLHMQDKLGSGMSNSLWPTIGCSPSYAVRWWSNNGMVAPPEIDPIDFLAGRIDWRYSYGFPRLAKGVSFLNDARSWLCANSSTKAKLLLTSPPYSGVTDYWNDHWIRLWVLGYELRKDWKRQKRYQNKEAYKAMITGVFESSDKHLEPRATVLVRSDARAHTSEICLDALQNVWPDRFIFKRCSKAPTEGISACHGKGGSKANEIDFLALKDTNTKEWKNLGFEPI